MTRFPSTLILLLAADLLASPAASGTTNAPLAWFRLDGTAKDAANQSPDLELKNAPFQERLLYLNGHYENGASELGCRAVAKVPGLTYDQFTVSVDLCPRDFRVAPPGWGFLRSLLAILTRGRLGNDDAWPHDTLVMAGTSYRWLGFRQWEGQLQLTLNNQDLVHTFTNVSVAAGKWHTLTCAADLARHEIRTFLDGKKLETVHLPDDFQFNMAGTPAEATEREFTFCNYSNGSIFHGYAADLKVFNGALSDDAVAAFLPWLAHRRPIPRDAAAGAGRWLWLIPILLSAAMCWSGQRRFLSGRRSKVRAAD